MDIIARKRGGVGFMYLVCALVGLILTASAFIDMGEMLPLLILGIPLTVISTYIFISYLALPYNVITLDKDNKLHLPKGVTLVLTDLLDVSYVRASARSIQYKWGSLLLTAKQGKFKYGYIADCEEVAKRLTDMMYRARYDSENPDFIDSYFNC